MAPGHSGFPRRVRSRVDDLPPDARERLDEMLADRSYTYQDISDELTGMGAPISKSAIGRYVMRTNREMREINLLVRKNEALLQFMAENPNFDAANASLALLINQLMDRIVESPDELRDIDADKAVGHLIRAVRQATLIERLNKDRGKAKADAREAVLNEVRDALTKQPELYERLEQLLLGGVNE